MSAEKLDFDEKYKDILKGLAIQEPDTREQYIREHVDNYDLFKMDALASISPYYYNALVKSQSDKGFTDYAALSVCGKFDPFSFLEAFNDAIRGYKYNSFTKFLENLFNQKQKTSLGAEQCDTAYGGMINASTKTKNSLMKFIHAEEKLLKTQSGKKISFEELQGRAPSSLSKKDIRVAYDLLHSFESIVSLDKNVDESDSDSGTLQEILVSTEHDPYESSLPITSSALESLTENWAKIEETIKLKYRVRYKMLLTQRMLKPLKLENIDGEEVIFDSYPYGDEDMYNLYRPFGIPLMQKIFNHPYLKRAYIRYPKVIYRVYADQLREDFNFDDKIAADVLKISKSTYSKMKNKFETDFFATLRKYDGWRIYDSESKEEASNE